jgi:ribosomal protein L11 methyltransferase
MRKRGADGWVELTARVSPEAAAGVGDVMLAATSGVEERGGRDEVTLVGYLPSRNDAERLVKRIRARLDALQAAGLHVGPARIATRRAAAQAWEGMARASMHVMRVPPNIVVRPTGARYTPLPGEVVIELDSAMAFGTGEHATTQGCLAALGRHIRGGEVVFDIGAGSGILAIAAAKLGARRVVGIEVDASAARIAARHVALNGVADTVAIVRGDALHCLSNVAQPRLRVGAQHAVPSSFGGQAPLGPRSLGEGCSAVISPARAHVIVANLTAPQIIELASDAAGHLRPGGIFIASGITTAQAADVQAAVAATGMILRDCAEQEQWVTMTWQAGDHAPAAD